MKESPKNSAICVWIKCGSKTKTYNKKCTTKVIWKHCRFTHHYSQWSYSFLIWTIEEPPEILEFATKLLYMHATGTNMIYQLLWVFHMAFEAPII